MMQRTLVILKPDAVKRWITGKVIDRLESKWLKLIACKMEVLTEEVLKEHYAHLVDKPFFPDIVRFMTSWPCILQIWEGFEIVEAVRIMAGITKARTADAGTIRWDLAMSNGKNVMHASEDEAAAQAEIARFFKPEELYEYTRADMEEIYENNER